MSGEAITGAGSASLLGKKLSVTEVCCESCGNRMGPGATANDKICSACGGNLIGMRIVRNALTGRILYAERVDL